MQPAPRDVPHWSEYSNAKTWIKSVDAATAAAVLSVDADKRLNILQCVVTPADAGNAEIYFAASAGATLSGDSYVAFGNYGAQGGENAGFPPYFPKRSPALGLNLYVKGQGVVRVRVYGYETYEA